MRAAAAFVVYSHGIQAMNEIIVVFCMVPMISMGLLQVVMMHQRDLISRRKIEEGKMLGC